MNSPCDLCGGALDRPAGLITLTGGATRPVCATCQAAIEADLRKPLAERDLSHRTDLARGAQPAVAAGNGRLQTFPCADRKGSLRPQAKCAYCGSTRALLEVDVPGEPRTIVCRDRAGCAQRSGRNATMIGTRRGRRTTADGADGAAMPQVALRVDSAVWERLDGLAERLGVPRAALARRAMRLGVERIEREGAAALDRGAGRGEV